MYCRPMYRPRLLGLKTTPQSHLVSFTQLQRPLGLYYIHYKNQQFLCNVVCILKLAIFGLRFYVFWNTTSKKRKNSRFWDLKNVKNVAYSRTMATAPQRRRRISWKSDLGPQMAGRKTRTNTETDRQTDERTNRRSAHRDEQTTSVRPSVCLLLKHKTSQQASK